MIEDEQPRTLNNHPLRKPTAVDTHNYETTLKYVPYRPNSLRMIEAHCRPKSDLMPPSGTSEGADDRRGI